MKNFLSKLKRLPFNQAVVPLALLSLAVLSYGIYFGWVGFYWDDWPWIFFSQAFGPEAMLEIDRDFRPLAGEVLWLGSRLFGDSSSGWQFYNLALRWLAGLSLWWTLKKLWPDQPQRGVWVAVIFVIYPGFGHQFIAVNTSRHMAPYVFFFLSLGVMLSAVARPEKFRQLIGASLALDLISLLTSEYYYGLELTRPLILWLALSNSGERSRPRINRMLKYYAPFFVTLAGIFAWRFQLSKTINYQTRLVGTLLENPMEAILSTASDILYGAYQSLLVAWLPLLDLLHPIDFGTTSFLYFIVLIAVGAIGTFFFLSFISKQASISQTWLQPFGLGAAAMLVGGLPFLIAGLDIDVKFPNDRAMLPLLFGTALVMVAVLERLVRKPEIRIVFLSLLVGLTLGAHFQSALIFNQSWKYHLSFFQQLIWRVPSLEPGTTLLLWEPPIKFSTDNSLTAPLNWIYDPENKSEEMPYLMLYVDLRLGIPALPSLDPGKEIFKNYLFYDFNGSTDQVLTMSYRPKKISPCLRVLHPDYDGNLFYLRSIEYEALKLSDLNLIGSPSAPQAKLPQILNQPEEISWCYYFQKADLARQNEDWEEVVRLGDSAQEEGFVPRDFSEWIPFIQGYAYAGEYEQAKELSILSLEGMPSLEFTLCRVWQEIAAQTPSNPERDQILGELQQPLDCPLP